MGNDGHSPDSTLGWRRAAAALPVLIPPAMMALFDRLDRRYGDR